MMTRESIKEIVDYSQEHGVTVKRRLQELNIPESNFYYAKRMYAREDMVSCVDGCFLQITGNPSSVVGMAGNMSRKSRGRTLRRRVP